MAKGTSTLIFIPTDVKRQDDYTNWFSLLSVLLHNNSLEIISVCKMQIIWLTGFIWKFGTWRSWTWTSCILCLPLRRFLWLVSLCHGHNLVNPQGFQNLTSLLIGRMLHEVAPLMEVGFIESVQIYMWMSNLMFVN